MSKLSIWAISPTGNTAPWPDLDVADERAARREYCQQRRQTPRSGFATCYRCDRNAAMFVYLRVSSLTPVCVDHAKRIVYAPDSCGSFTESGPYKG